MPHTWVDVHIHDCSLDDLITIARQNGWELKNAREFKAISLEITPEEGDPYTDSKNEMQRQIKGKDDKGNYVIEDLASRSAKKA